MSEYESDLAVLVAASNTGAAVRGLLARQESLGIRVVEYELYVHPERDPGCFLKAHDFLRPMHRRCAHALVLFDRYGSGRERLTGSGSLSRLARQAARPAILAGRGGVVGSQPCQTRRSQAGH